MTRPRLILLGTVLALLGLPMFAVAGWPLSGTGNGYSKAHTISGGSTPTASVSNRSVTVSWSAPGGSVPPSGYIVKRYNTSGGLQTIGASCSGTVSGTSCTETGVPAGDWKYSVTPVRQNWTGAESSQSSTVTVLAPTLTLSPRIMTSLPSTLSGSIANYIPSQTVTYRLDNPSSGTVLTGSISPDPVQSSGSATVSVTIPSGTSNGTHTVYAVGSSGDAASTTINVSVASSGSTSDWNLKDASAGAGEVDASDPFGFASDSLFDTSGNFANAFSSSRYLSFDLNNTLPGGTAPSSVSFNFNFSATDGSQVCFYFEVYRASTSTLIGTHGSSGSPVACQTGTTFNTTSTTLSEVTSTTIANDLRIKVYGKNSGGRPFRTDLATVSATISGQSYTLFEDSSVDSADGSPATTTWSLYGAGDGISYTAAANWPAAASTSKYLKFAFPAYVPSGANFSSATFKHSYVQGGGGTTCFYYEVFNGATSLGTHGSASSPYSCNASGTVYQTDTISLPEVTTAAQANNLVVKAYGTNTANHTSKSDLAQLDVTYTQSSPGMTLTSGTITALPATKTGQIQNFASGQTVTFRLDNPDSGTVLTGSISPDPVQSSGSATVSVTIPSGTSNGTHTVYAIGSAGDIASASITVNRQTTITFSDWDLRDASAGASEVNSSDALSFASDNLIDTTTNWATNYATNRYMQFSYDSPLKSSATVSSASFNFSFTANGGAETGCYYFEVYQASTGALLGTHGSSASPIACATAGTYTTTSTPLAEVTSGAVADDLQIQVYGKESNSRPFKIDLATVSVTAGGQGYTLYENTFDDAADSSAASFPWSLYGSGDAVFYQALSNWATTFSTSRYLKFTFPAYVPTAATIDSVTFNHSYVQNGGGTTCFYYEIFNGTTSLGTHGSAASPYSCNASGTAYLTDSISLPEVTTAAAANNLVVKAYGQNSATHTSRTDQVQLQISYESD